MREVNKKVLGIAVALMAVAMLAVPVMADPTKGQKVAVTITWIPTGTEIIEDTVTGNVIHRLVLVNWTVVLAIEDGPTYNGAALLTERNVLVVPQKDGATLILHESYEMWFPNEGGGFEGSALIIIEGYNPVIPTWEKAKAHGLLHGYGAFEGQTINAGHHWVAPVGPPVWTGYLLKP